MKLMHGGFENGNGRQIAMEMSALPTEP